MVKKTGMVPVVDFHTHFFPENVFHAIWKWFDENAWVIQHKVPAEELVQRLKSIGVSKMVLLNYAHKPGMSRMLNRWTRGFAGKHQEIIPFGTVHPLDEDRDEILTECLEEWGFYGLKVHVIVLGVAVDDPVFFPIYEKIEELGKILLLHGANGPILEGSSVDHFSVAGVRRVKVILKRYPRLKLVIPHLGIEETDEFFDLMEEHENLWMDTTMTLADYFPKRPSLERIERLSDRILYGSDAPNIPYPLDTEMTNIKKWFSKEVQEKLFFRNALKILGLKP